jgi:hypothetical protein
MDDSNDYIPAEGELGPPCKRTKLCAGGKTARKSRWCHAAYSLAPRKWSPIFTAEWMPQYLDGSDVSCTQISMEGDFDLEASLDHEPHHELLLHLRPPGTALKLHKQSPTQWPFRRRTNLRKSDAQRTLHVMEMGTALWNVYCTVYRHL